MGRVIISVLGLLVALVAVAEAIDCWGVRSNIDECSNYLSDPNEEYPPESSCCNAISNLVHMGDAKSLCDCLTLFGYHFLPSKAKKIPNACVAPAFAPLIPCITDQSTTHDVVPDSILPPVNPAVNN